MSQVKYIFLAIIVIIRIFVGNTRPSPVTRVFVPW